MNSARDRAVGAGTQLASQVSINFGSSIAGLLIPVVGTLAVVTVRQLVTASVLWPLTRPRLRGRSWRMLWPALALGVAIAAMNLTFYESVDRLGLGMAATIEYLGPLGLALATSRRILDATCALAAGVGVYLLLAGTPSTPDALGILFALAAAACWAGYILLTRKVAAQLPGLDGLSVASIVALILVAPPALLSVDYTALDLRVVGLLVATGLLCSAIPYSLDTFVLRRITPRLYAIVTSFGPVIATVFGVLVLAEEFTPQQLLAIVLVCVAAAIALATQRDRPTSELETTATITP